MRGTSSPYVKLTGDFGNATAATRIGGCFSRPVFVKNSGFALGYVEGQNIVIEQRYAAAAYDRLGELAAELVRLEMDVIVVDGTPAAKAAKAATARIPIVFTLVSDPVALGLASSLTRPGANLTGLTSSVGFQLAGKRVELLKDIKPGLARLAVLTNPDQPGSGPYLREAEKTAGVLGLTVRAFDARTPDDLSAAFAAMVEWRANGVTTPSDGMFYSQQEHIVTLARENRLVSVHPETSFSWRPVALSRMAPACPICFCALPLTSTRFCRREARGLAD